MFITQSIIIRYFWLYKLIKNNININININEIDWINPHPKKYYAMTNILEILFKKEYLLFWKIKFIFIK